MASFRCCLARSLMLAPLASGLARSTSLAAPCEGQAAALLHFDGRARAFQLGLRLLGVFLRDLFEHRLRRAVDEVLGLLQPEARERADLLDDLDLLVAGGGEDDVELILLLRG